MTITISKPSQNPFVKALIFGPHGHGKTHLLGTAQFDERTAPMLFLDFEGGTSSLAGLDIDKIEIRSWEDYNEVYTLIKRSEEFSKYKSIGIDSISETNIFALLQVVFRDKRGNVDEDELAQRDYGVVLIQMRRLLRRFRDLPKHIFLTANSTEVTLPRLGTVQTANMQGKLVTEVPAMMDIVAYMALDDKNGQRSLLLHDVPRFAIKCRTPWVMAQPIPQFIDEPTITKLLDALYPTGRAVNTNKEEIESVAIKEPASEALDSTAVDQLNALKEA